MSAYPHINVLELDDEQLAAVRDKLQAAGVKIAYGDPAGEALAAMQNDAPGTALTALRTIAAIGTRSGDIEQPLAQVLEAARGARILLGDLPPDTDPTHARLA